MDINDFEFIAIGGAGNGGKSDSGYGGNWFGGGNGGNDGGDGGNGTSKQVQKEDYRQQVSEDKD